jgi:ERF superfamily
MRRPSPSPDEPQSDLALADATAGVSPMPAPPVPAATAHPAAVGAPPSDPILLMIANAARDPAVDIEKFERLMALRERAGMADARRSFYGALARAKGEFGPILKTRQVDYAHKDGGGRTNYKYEELADVGAVVDPVLSKHGLSYRHKSTQEGGKIRVTCILSHEDGYSEENSLEGVEDKSGMKNPNQAIASTVTYLQRYSLKEALGIAAGRDDDAAIASEPPFTMTSDEIIYVEDLLRDTKSDLPKFLEAIGAASIAEFSSAQYKRSVALLNEKKRREAAQT